MAGKATVIASRLLAGAIHAMSKNALLDILVDRAIQEAGEGASDDQLAAIIQSWAEPVLRVRSDPVPNIAGRMRRFQKASDKWRAAHEPAERV